MEIKFNGMGLFTTDKTWIHPDRCEKTYEIIYVTKGTVHLFEENTQYSLKKGDLILLKPHVFHGGFQKSTGDTSFYWVHIFGNLPEDMCGACEQFQSGWLFRELMDYANTLLPNDEALRIVCEHILLNIRMHREKDGHLKLAKDIYEWVRINTNAKLTIRKTALHFGYNAEHISRIIKREYGVRLKKIIDAFLIDKIKDSLVNTDYSVKEIAAITEFSDSSAMINFFKYHEKISPTTFRNLHTGVHMNLK